MEEKKTGVERVIETTQGHLPKQLFVLAGPSGVGKYTITQRLLESHPAMQRVVTYTTRPSRPEEVEGDQYHFITLDEFRARAKDGDLLEVDGTDVYGEGYLYSMPADIMAAPEDKHMILAEVDINGSRLLREVVPGCITIFVTAPPADLLERIRGRDGNNTDAASLTRRLETAREQIRAAKEFDYIIFNESDNLDQTVAAVEAIIAAERNKVRQGVALEAMLPDEAFDTILEETS